MLRALTEPSRLYLVRHGAVHNPERVRYGRLPGYALSELGRTQIQETARWLDAQPRRPTRIVTSPLERAAQSGAILGEHLGIDARSTDERVIEARSRFDGLGYRRDLLAHVQRALFSGDRDEDPQSVADRMRRAIVEHAAGDGPVVIVSHQLPIQYVRLAVVGAPRRVRSWHRRARCETASAYVLAVEGPRLRFEQYFEPRLE